MLDVIVVLVLLRHVALRGESRRHEFGQWLEWIFCLTAAKMWAAFQEQR